MSVNTRNPKRFDIADSRGFRSGDSRLSDCGPNAVRNVYEFFGVKCPITYKNFERAGFTIGHGVPINKTRGFITSKLTGLDVKVVKIKGKGDFVNKVQLARERNHPIIITSPEHLYTIIPHEIIAKTDNYYSARTFTPHHNKLREYYDMPVYKIEGFKTDLCLCVNSSFGDYSNNSINSIRLSDDQEFLRFFCIEFVYNKFLESNFFEVNDGLQFYEVKGVKISLNCAKYAQYEWGATAKEYKKLKYDKKIKIERSYKELIKIFHEGCKYNNLEISSKSLSLLYEKVFTVYGIGETLKDNFNKNLPALIKDIVN